MNVSPFYYVNSAARLERLCAKALIYGPSLTARRPLIEMPPAPLCPGLNRYFVNKLFAYNILFHILLY